MVMVLLVSIRVAQGVVKGVPLVVGSQVAIGAGPVVVEGSSRDGPANCSQTKSPDIPPVSSRLKREGDVAPPLT